MRRMNYFRPAWIGLLLLLQVQLLLAQADAPSEGYSDAASTRVPDIPAGDSDSIEQIYGVEGSDLDRPPLAANSEVLGNERIKALEQKLAQQELALTTRIEEIERAQEELALSQMPTGFEPNFSIFGFFDLTFNALFPKKGSFFDGMVSEDPTFMMQNLNLYFKSEMTESLSTLVELRFTFAPNGQVLSYGVEGVSDYQRVDTTVLDPFSAEEYRVGGVRIERVHLTWRPKDWLGVLAGRYLTPYGIWNIEHGSPVILGIRPPFSQTAHYLPLSQTGIQLFGDFILTDTSKLSYGLTFSNGRGPMDEVYDLNANKAGGVRLRYVYDTRVTQFSLGGYGYLNKYTDSEIEIASVSPFRGDVNKTEEYKEYVGSLDVLLEVHGVRAQGEFLRRLVRYDIRPYRTFDANDRGTIGYPADYVGTSFYGLLGYTLPLQGNVRVTPYILGEYVELDDIEDSSTGVNLLGGLNVKPSSFVTLKTEYYYVFFPKWETASGKNQQFSGIAAQVAVSF